MRTQRDRDTSQTAASEARTGKRKSKPGSLTGAVASTAAGSLGASPTARRRQPGPDAVWVQLLRATQEKAQDVEEAHQTLIEAHQTLIGAFSASGAFSGSGALLVEEPEVTAADMDALLERLDQGIAAEQVAMDRLLERMASRTSR
jgi:hypothetical protein